MIPARTAALPIFPLVSTALPGDRLPLQVFEARFRDLLHDCMKAPDGPWFGAVLIARGSEVGGGDERTDVGVRTHIDRQVAVGPRLFHLRCTAGARFRVRDWLDDDPYPRAEIEPWPDSPVDAAAVRRAAAELTGEITALHGLLARVAERQARPAPPRPRFDDLPADPGDLIYDLARRVGIGAADRFKLLCAPDPLTRAQVLAEAVDTAQDVARFHLLDH